MRLGILLFLSIGVVVSGSACGWDWTVRSIEEADASTPNDAGADADISDGGAADVIMPAEASDDCPSLLATVASTKTSAITCTLGAVSDCTSEVNDECGCGVFVEQNASTASQNFANAVSAAKASGCTTQCSGCTALPARGTCVEQGSAFLCSPP